jgi:hypothetical protein
MGWEEEFGLSIPDAVAARMRTPRDAAEYISAQLGAVANRNCRTARAFRAVRAELIARGVPRAAVRPEARISELTPRVPDTWDHATALLGAAWRAGPGGLCARMEQRPPCESDRLADSLANLARTRAAAASDLRPAVGEPWSREAVALTVRRVVMDEMGLEWFDDDARFYEDLRVD